MEYNLKFKCVQDFFMHTYEDEEPEIAYIKGEVYQAFHESEERYVFIDAQGDVHYMNTEDDEGILLSDYLIQE